MKQLIFTLLLGVLAFAYVPESHAGPPNYGALYVGQSDIDAEQVQVEVAVAQEMGLVYHLSTVAMDMPVVAVSEPYHQAHVVTAISITDISLPCPRKWVWYAYNDGSGINKTDLTPVPLFRPLRC